MNTLLCSWGRVLFFSLSNKFGGKTVVLCEVKLYCQIFMIVCKRGKKILSFGTDCYLRSIYMAFFWDVKSWKIDTSCHSWDAQRPGFEFCGQVNQVVSLWNVFLAHVSNRPHVYATSKFMTNQNPAPFLFANQIAELPLLHTKHRHSYNPG